MQLSAGLFLAVIAVGLLSPLAWAQSRSTADLDFFVGRWEGQGAFLRPFEPGAARVDETVQASCEYVLSNAHILCESTWRRASGQTRGVFMIWNFNEVSGDCEGLFVASNYGQEASYPIRWDETERAYVGVTATALPDGRPATERAVYRLSPDRRTLSVDEFVRSDDAATGAWMRTYAYVWRRTD